MSEREEVLNEFGTAECVKRDDCTHFDCVAERKMADEIVRLREQLAVSESLREAQVKELSGHILTLTEALSEDGDALTTAERERDEAREELERERLRLAACGVAARGESRSVNTIYTSDSLKAVVDLYTRADTAERERGEARRDRDQWRVRSTEHQCNSEQWHSRAERAERVVDAAKELRALHTAYREAAGEPDPNKWAPLYAQFCAAEVALFAALDAAEGTP